MTIATDTIPTRPANAPNENSMRALVVHTYLEARRVLTGTFKSPAGFIQAVAYPALTVVMFWVVLGQSVDRANKLLAGGQPSIYGYVALMSIMGGMTGSAVSALSLLEEKSNGLIGRMWTLPIHRASALLGRLVAESLRLVLTTAALVLVGALLGFRFRGGLGEIALFFLVPLMFGLAFAVAVSAVAVAFSPTRLMEWIVAISTLLMFFNAGFVPVAAYPQWLQAAVEAQPISVAVRAMLSLSWSGSTAGVLHVTLLSGALFFLFVGPAVWGYRRAAQTS